MTYPNHRGTEEQRFWKRVQILENGCWQWTGGKTDGYGCFSLMAITGQPQRHVRAYVWTWQKYVGPVPEGKELDHLCRNRACVNPLHIEPVTKRVNILRGSGAPAINARKTHCKRGHPFTGENVATFEYKGKVCRRCRECVRQVNGRRVRDNKEIRPKGKQ